MKQDYFIHDGIKYVSGDEIKLMNRFPYDQPVFHDLVYFICYDTEYNVVQYRMKETGQRRGCSLKAFLKQFGGATGYNNPYIHPPEVKQLKDSQIPKLVVGWGWYIVIMLFLAITTVAIPGWIITSLIFNSWRNKVIKEEGHYVEW